MENKNKIIFSIGLVMLIISAIMKSKGINAVVLIGASFIVIFFVYALLDASKKHKKNAYEDQKKAIHHYLGGNAPPEVKIPRDIEGKK